MTYDYKCKNCGAESEVEHPMSYEGEVRCIAEFNNKQCNGLMYKIFKTIPSITRHSLPTRKNYMYSKK